MVDTHPIFTGSSSTSSSITWNWANGQDTGHVRTDKGAPVPPASNIAGEGNKSYRSQTVGGFPPGTWHSLTIHNWDANWGNHNQIQPWAETRSASSYAYAMISRRGEEFGVPQKFFDLLVPEEAFLAHYTLPVDANLNNPWHLADTMVLPQQALVQDTAISIIQSFNTPDKLEALALTSEQSLTSFEFTPDTGVQNSFPITLDGAPDRVTANPALVQNDTGLFQLLVPGDGIVLHYIHSNETLEGSWKLVSSFAPPQGTNSIAIALVQSDSAGSLIAAVRVRPEQGSDFLVIYQSDPNFTWRSVSKEVLHNQLIDRVTGNPSLFRSTNDSQSSHHAQENLELLVSRDGTIHHYTQPFRQELGVDEIGKEWKLVQKLQHLNNDPNKQAIAVSITQSIPGRLEAFARVQNPGSDDLMIAYQFTKGGGWQEPIQLHDENGQPITARDSSTSQG